MQIHVGTLTLKISLKTLQVQTFSLAPAEKKEEEKGRRSCRHALEKMGIPEKMNGSQFPHMTL